MFKINISKSSYTNKCFIFFLIKVFEDEEYITKLGKSAPLVAFREDKGNETLKNIVKELKESIGVIDNIQQQQNLNDSITTTSMDVHKGADAKHEVCFNC